MNITYNLCSVSADHLFCGENTALVQIAVGFGENFIHLLL
jgi:hypothetical protein